MPVPTKPVDAVDDSNHQLLFKLSKLVPMPDFVKSAASVDAEEAAQLPRVVFADSVNRKFPCHTKAATWLSQLYFLESRHQYPTRRAAEVQDRINKAAAYFAIGGMTKAAKESWEQHNNPAAPDLPDGDYAIVIDYEGAKVRRLPISNAENVKMAAQQLYQKRADYPYEWRIIAARKILHKAAELNAPISPELGEYLCKAAGFGSTMSKEAATKLGYRVLMLPKTAKDVRAKAAKLATTIAKLDDFPPPAQLIKLAAIVDRLDREHGIHRHYGEGVETPEEMFFNVTEKRASAIGTTLFELTTGTAISKDMLHRCDLQKVAGALGQDFVKAVMSADSLDIDMDKFAAVARTLPRNDALILERALQSAGIPITQPEAADVL